MDACVLIDMGKLRVVKRAPTVHQLEYWAELLCKNRDFRIQGPENRHFSTFSMVELGQLYMNTNGPSGKMVDYNDAIAQVQAMIARLPIDETPVKELAKKLGYEIKTAEVPLPKSGYTGMQEPSGTRSPEELVDSAPAPKTKRGKKAATEEPAPKPVKAAKEPAAPKVKRSPADPSGRPAAGSATGKVWDIADKVLKANGKLAKDSKELRAKVIEACEKAGINKSTAGVQFGKWKAA